MAAVKYDYPALRKQYLAIPGPAVPSIRELCRRNNIPENTRAAVQRRANSEGWEPDRQKVLAKSTEQVTDAIAGAEARRALRIAEVENNALDMADEMIDQVRGRMKKLRPVTTMVEKDGETVEEVVDYVPDLLVRPEELGKLFKSLGEMRAAPARQLEQPQGGNGNGGRSVSVSVPEGTELALVARYVQRVRDEGGPIDVTPAGDAGQPALQSGAAGAGEGAVQP